MIVRAYLRASTREQDAARARARLETFAAGAGLRIAATYVETESGTRLARPELFRLLADSRAGDVLLVEQVDRLSRLGAADWARLKSEIARRKVRIVALDLPTSHGFIAPGAGEGEESFTARMAEALNAMLLDVLAAVARKDLEDRRRRQAEGQARARREGRYKGRPENRRRNEAIAAMLQRGVSWSQIQAATDCSRATVAKIARRLREAAAGS